MNKSLGEEVRLRADGRCEYCQMPAGVLTLVFSDRSYRSHCTIIARQHGGETRDDPPLCARVGWYNRGRAMPTISSFYGIVIRMFFNDHDPPHVHARYGEFEATIEIDSLHVMKGQLPRRVLDLVSEWAVLHRAELIENWRLCREKMPPAKIDPLS